MTDNTQPEAMDLADWLEAVGGGPSAKRCAALLREQRARIAELESKLEAIGAGGGSGPLMGRVPLSANAGEPVAWQYRSLPDVGGVWFECSKERAEQRAAHPDRWEVRPLYAAPPTAQAEGWRPPALEWDEVFDCAVAAYCRSSTSHDALRLCFQSRTQQHQISCGWTAHELMDFARGIARLYTPPTSAEGVEP